MELKSRRVAEEKERLSELFSSVSTAQPPAGSIVVPLTARSDSSMTSNRTALDCDAVSPVHLGDGEHVSPIRASSGSFASPMYHGASRSEYARKPPSYKVRPGKKAPKYTPEMRHTPDCEYAYSGNEDRYDKRNIDERPVMCECPSSHWAIALLAVCCSLPFGLAATGFSIQAFQAAKRGNVKSEKRNRLISLAISFTGLFLTCTGIFAFIAYVVFVGGTKFYEELSRYNTPSRYAHVRRSINNITTM